MNFSRLSMDLRQLHRVLVELENAIAAVQCSPRGATFPGTDALVSLGNAGADQAPALTGRAHNRPLSCAEAIVLLFAGSYLFNTLFARMGLDSQNVFTMLALLDDAQTLLSDAALQAGRRCCVLLQRSCRCTIPWTSMPILPSRWPPQRLLIGAQHQLTPTPLNFLQVSVNGDQFQAWTAGKRAEAGLRHQQPG